VVGRSGKCEGGTGEVGNADNGRQSAGRENVKGRLRERLLRRVKRDKKMLE